MAIYTIATANDTIDLVTIFKYINNTASSGLFFPAILMGIWFMSFIGMFFTNRRASHSFIFANFLCALLSIMLGLLDMMAPMYIYFFIILLGFGIIWVKLETSI